MGSGIAQAVAQAGFPVTVRDLTSAQLERGRGLIEKTLAGAVQRHKITEAKRSEILGRITFSTDLAASLRGARLVIEAVFEEEAVKRALFEEAGPHLEEGAIVATNTSSLSVDRLSACVPHPERFAGLHFFYPAAINKLLEVVGGPKTDAATLATLEAFGYTLRKIPIRVRDTPGFAVNRFFVPYMNEAVRLAAEGVASLATIEQAGRELTGSSNGPLEVMNLTGLPIGLHSMETLEAAFGPAYEPAELLEEQVAAGKTWPWRDSQVEADRLAAVRSRFEGLLVGIATRLVEEGGASPEAIEAGALVGLRWKHGPFAVLNALGLAEGLKRAQEYGRRYGPEAFPISDELVRRAAAGEHRWPLQYVRTEHRGHVAWVLLDRPAVLNSLNSEVLDQLASAFHRLRRESSVRAVVLAGAGPVFCAGADIAEMATKTVPQGRAFGFHGQEVCRAIEEFPSPVIALVEGYALGGGLEIALSADLILAAETAKLGLPEVTVGIHPGFGGASRLTRLIGRARAKLVVFTGQTFTAPEAHALGFVTTVVPPGSAKAEAQALAEMIASRAPLAVGWAKSVINRGIDGSLEGSLRLEGESAGHTFATEDRTEGMRAFLERRPPKFQGQ